MKLKRKWVVVLCAVVFVMSTVVVQAALYGITADVQTKYFIGNYEYGKSGSVLKLEAAFVEKHIQTKQRYSDMTYNIVVGANTGVKVNRTADIGYNYLEVDFTGYANGTKQATLLNAKP